MKNSIVKKLTVLLLTASLLCGMTAYAGEGDETHSSEASKVQSDTRTEELTEEYEQWLNKKEARAVSGNYSAELAKFPSDYQTLLKKLHEKHPNWIFVAVNTGLDWNEVVKNESVSGKSTGTNRSLLPKTAGSLLLSKADTDYDAAKGSYIAKDGSTWVSASKPAVAYYVDPRNFLTDEYIFLFEALNYNSKYHNLTGVENILKGTDLANKKITYTDTKGKQISLSQTYGETILSAGAKMGVSPLFLAAKIKQETGGKLSNGSISGKFSYNGKTYQGYYNYYNIGATSTSTGSAVANGLNYAKSGTTYLRPWTSPVLSITGGAEYIGKSYISRGQNTLYFERFNTVVSPYYQHQYMQNLTGAASEANTTYKAYKSMGITEDSYVFYIPVYKNMPSQSTTVTITKNVKQATAVSGVTLRKGPSTAYASLGSIPKGASVTVSGGCYTDTNTTVSSQQSNPYWLKVTYGSKTGYVSSGYLKMNTDSKIKAGATKQLSVKLSNGGETVYYETSDPAVATVSASGKITGVKKGTCMIYAVTSSGKALDAVGIEVIADTTSGNTSGSSGTVTTPAKTYTKYKTTTKVNYRSGAGTTYSTKGTLASGKEIEVENGYSKSANGYTWYRFKLNGKEYYIASKYLKKVTTTASSGSTATKTYTKYKTTTKVNYRSGAGTTYSTKGALASGKEIEVENGYSKSANGYTWYRFRMNGKEYYIASKYLKKVTTTASSGSTASKKYTKYKTTTRVNYRSGAGTSYSTKGTLASGKQIEVENGYSKSANGYTWYRFKMNEKDYYIASKYLKKV